MDKPITEAQVTSLSLFIIMGVLGMIALAVTLTGA